MAEKQERPRYEVAVINAKPMFLQIDMGDESRWNKELVFALQIVLWHNHIIFVAVVKSCHGISTNKILPKIIQRVTDKIIRRIHATLMLHVKV